MSFLNFLTKNGSCKIEFSDSRKFLLNLKEELRVLIITDENIHRIYGKRWEGIEAIVLKAGEGSKTLRNVERIYRDFLKNKVDRSTLIVGIGGGTVSDVTGFAASTFMRGVPFGFVPTTLLAQIDASIGGKNGVNFLGLKNMIGTIRQPEFCLVDFSFLRTLPPDQILSGMAEMVKCGIILKENLFDYIEKNFPRIISLEEPYLSHAVSGAVEAKMNVVKRDEMDTGERMKLNFGHTVGHAIEKVTGLPHGYSVAIGMVAESRLAVWKGILSSGEAVRIEGLLKAMGLPTESTADGSAVLNAIERDKKGSADFIYIPLPDRIGVSRIHKIRKDELKFAVQEVCE